MTKIALRSLLYFLAIAVAVVIAFGPGFSGLISKARAAMSDFSQPCTTADATSTIAYLTAGTGTTTLTCSIGAIHRLANDTVQLNFQLTATSTGVSVPTVNTRFEYSYDKIDWYPLAIPDSGINQSLGSAGATTTQMTSDPYNSLSFKVASSTNGFGGSGTATRIHVSADIPVNAPHVRVIFSSPAGGGNFGLWASLFGKISM